MFLIVAVLILAALFFWVTTRPASPASTGIKLVFIGLTNLPAKGNFAVFAVSNSGPERVAFNADAIAYRSSQGWTTNSLRNTTRRDWVCWFPDTNGNSRLGSWSDFGGDLGPGSSAVFGAPVPVTNFVWRLDFYCVEKATGVPGLVDRTSDFAQHALSVLTNGAARNQETFSGRRYHVLGPEISQ
jgi:hypothetical protein